MFIQLRLFKISLVFMLFGLLCLNQLLLSEETALEKFEPRYIVDAPTAGILENMSYCLDAKLVGSGGFLFDFTASFFKFMNLGLSYGGTGVIGAYPMNLQKYPGVHLKFRLFNEDTVFPAIAIGFNSQGKGTYFYDKSENNNSVNQRHQQLSPDFYLVASKSFT